MYMDLNHALLTVYRRYLLKKSNFENILDQKTNKPYFETFFN